MAQKIKVNDNLTNIFNFIQSSQKRLSFMDLIQYCIDYDLYKEFYLNQQIIFRLLDEKNQTFEKKGGFDETETVNF